MVHCSTASLKKQKKNLTFDNLLNTPLWHSWVNFPKRTKSHPNLFKNRNHVILIVLKQCTKHPCDTASGTQETSTISKTCSITTWMSFSFDAMCWREFCDLRNARVTKEYLPQFFPCYPKKTRLSCSETPGSASGQLHLQSIPVNFVECCKCLPMIHWTPPTHEGSFVLHSSLQHVFFSQAILECWPFDWDSWRPIMKWIDRTYIFTQYPRHPPECTQSSSRYYGWRLDTWPPLNVFASLALLVSVSHLFNSFPFYMV